MAGAFLHFPAGIPVSYVDCDSTEMSEQLGKGAGTRPDMRVELLRLKEGCPHTHAGSRDWRKAVHVHTQGQVAKGCPRAHVGSRGRSQDRPPHPSRRF